MNALYGALPLEIEGYAVNGDFRAWMAFECAMQRGARLRDVVRAVGQCFRRLPPTMEEAVRLAVAFYEGGMVPKRQTKTEAAGDRIYDFDADAPYLYGAFRAQYGIDLSRAELHWYQFRALFLSLDEHHLMMKIMRWRIADIAQIKDSAQKKFIRKMKRLYALPDGRSEEEKQRAMAEALSAMMK